MEHRPCDFTSGRLRERSQPVQGIFPLRSRHSGLRLSRSSSRPSTYMLTIHFASIHLIHYKIKFKVKTVFQTLPPPCPNQACSTKTLDREILELPVRFLDTTVGSDQNRHLEGHGDVSIGQFQVGHPGFPKVKVMTQISKRTRTAFCAEIVLCLSQKREGRHSVVLPNRRPVKFSLSYLLLHSVQSSPVLRFAEMILFKGAARPPEVSAVVLQR